MQRGSPRPLSGKYHRAQSAPPRKEHRIVRLERLEDGDELRLGRPVVPLPVAAKQLQKLVHRLLRLPAGIERGREVEPRLQGLNTKLTAVLVSPELATQEMQGLQLIDPSLSSNAQ